jgi:hypothetical protein
MQLGEIAKANPGVAIGSYPFFDPQNARSERHQHLAIDAQMSPLSYRDQPR